MGKRKRENEEEESSKSKKIKIKKEEDSSGSEFELHLPDTIYNEEVDGYSLNSSEERYLESNTVDFQSPMKKKEKKRKSVSFDKSVVFPPSSDDNTDVSRISNGSPEKPKKKKHSVEQNGSEMNGNGDEFVFYLIRKPIEITLDELGSLNLPVDPSKSRKVKLKKDGTTYVMRPEEVRNPMAYFPARNTLTIKDTHKIRNGGLISAHCVLAPVQKKVAGPRIYDEGEDIPDDAPLGFEIPSIRKNPDVDWDSKEQRLHAFGVKPAKKSNKKLKRVKKEV